MHSLASDSPALPLSRPDAGEGATFDVQRVIVDGDLVAIHVRATPPGRAVLAVADFYRLADGLIVEHWDLLQPVPESTASGNGMF